MAKPREEELIQRSLDGMLEADEHVALTRLLADDGDARSLHDQLVSVHLTLDKGTSYEPPSDLAGSVMTKLRARQVEQIRSEHNADTIVRRFFTLYTAGWSRADRRRFLVGVIRESDRKGGRRCAG